MSLEITLTGQLAAEADGNRADATDLPGRQAPMVFAYLVTERDRPVPSEELAEAVWGGALPPTWRPALRGVVSKVRAFLDLLGLPAAATLTSSSGCYRLTLPSDTAVDVELAAGEVDTARRALGAGQPQRAVAAAGRARTIAGRPLLPGHNSAWVEDRRAALHQLLLSCLALLADAHLAAGQAELAVGPAADLVALEPFRDSAHRRLLAAHAAAGDRGEALRAYDRYRRVLAEEPGGRPLSRARGGLPGAAPRRAGRRHPGPGRGAGRRPAARPRPRRVRRPERGAAPAHGGLGRHPGRAAPDHPGGRRGRHRQDPAGHRAGLPGRAGRGRRPGRTLRPAPRGPLPAAAGGGGAAPGRLPLRTAPGPARPESGRAGPVLAGAGLAPPRPPGPVRDRHGRRPLPAAGGPHRAPGGDRRHRAAAAAGRRPPRRRRGQPAAAPQPGRGPPAGPAADRPDLPGRRAHPPGHPDRRPRRPGPRPRGRAGGAGRARRRRGRGDGRGGRRPAARPGRPGSGRDHP